jgi:hypothetical protein
MGTSPPPSARNLILNNINNNFSIMNKWVDREVTYHDISLSSRFVDNFLVIIVSETTTELLVVHLGLVLADSASSSNFIRVRQLELPTVSRPRNKTLACLVCEKLFQVKIAIIHASIR